MDEGSIEYINKPSDNSSATNENVSRECPFCEAEYGIEREGCIHDHGFYWMGG